MHASISSVTQHQIQSVHCPVLSCPVQSCAYPFKERDWHLARRMPHAACRMPYAAACNTRRVLVTRYNFNSLKTDQKKKKLKKSLNFDSKRPPSSSLSYGGAMNDDARSPGAGSTPGPLSQQPPVLDTSDPA
ncbi:hypothetical protein AWZ03_009582 [Drosophila navojoa]|uniref:Uncharacterized protein n=1 Tax=Drosophila navojoa TaxID=7232 RepID=A0A484B7F0_DRONA|nr:hypothetical protein AWZ03_009582 [Drosophila navojoa]